MIAPAALAILATTTSVLMWRENRRLRTTGGAVTGSRQIGALAPQFSLPSTARHAVSLQDLLADDRACVLMFVSPGCGPCQLLVPELARWHDTITERLALTLVTPAEPTQAEALAREHALADVLIDEQATVMHQYGVWGTPSAILVPSDGTVRSAPVAGHVAIESLIRLALQRETQPLLPETDHYTPFRGDNVAAKPVRGARLGPMLTAAALVLSRPNSV